MERSTMDEPVETKRQAPIDPRLLEILVCPLTKGPLENDREARELSSRTGGLASPGAAVVAVEPVGHYAVRLVFDDRHDTGIYSWDYLRELGRDHQRRWDAYLAALEVRGMSRDRAAQSPPPLAAGR